ncbi:MAG: hypothetical protein AAF721_41185 [Myxococcota bacterium]
MRGRATPAATQVGAPASRGGAFGNIGEHPAWAKGWTLYRNRDAAEPD